MTIDTGGAAFAELAYRALQAHHAWALAEDIHEIASFDERMDLCKYAQWLTDVALGLTTVPFSGVPHLLRAAKDEEACAALVLRVYADAEKRRTEATP